MMGLRFRKFKAKSKNKIDDIRIEGYHDSGHSPFNGIWVR
jgi:hypothetical protein